MKNGPLIFALTHFLRLNNQYLNGLITTDELTNLSNRRSFDEVLKRELHRSIRDEKILMLAIIDIDYFKKYNDYYGHPKGDQVLSLFGKLIKRNLRRASDFGFRIGGEEFAVITVVETPQVGVAAIKKVMRKLAAKKIEHEANPDSGIVTVSVGVAYHHAEDIMTDEELYIAADKALYKAKEQGRNQLVEYSTELKS
ncbi:MAG: GGDEF domain-containing protein [Pseudomonadota bacterium]|nr:GGDEF domain-containing protein [Pseudomonadota bacterium]